MIAHGLSVSNPSLVQIDHSPLVIIKLSSAVCVKSLQFHYMSGQHMLKWIDLTRLFLSSGTIFVANCQVCAECRTDGKSTLKVHRDPLEKNRKWIRRRSKSSSVECSYLQNCWTICSQSPGLYRTDGKSTLKVHPGPLQRKPKWVIQRSNKFTRVQCNAMIAQHSNERLLQKWQHYWRTINFVKNVELLLIVREGCRSIVSRLSIMCLRMVNLE